MRGIAFGLSQEDKCLREETPSRINSAEKSTHPRICLFVIPV